MMDRQIITGFWAKSKPLLAFASIAGLGWILDLLILTYCVRSGFLPAGAANVVSSLSAASLVYLLSHRQVHHGHNHMLAHRLGGYLFYTIALVFCMSAVLDILTHLLAALLDGAWALTLAKILITPPQFILNFLVSRYLALKEGQSSK